MRDLKVTQLLEVPRQMAESFNQLRVSLGFCGAGLKVVMVTSSLPNEGKSFVTFNLWRAIATTGAKTLLVDCDLRNSSLVQRAGLVAANGGPDVEITGLAHYLAGQADIEDCLWRTDVPNGYVIPIGSSVGNPSLLLESNLFSSLMEQCRQSFDFVLVDTPPLGSVADAMNITRHCDGTLMVIRSGSTSRRMVANSLQLLERAGAHLLGTVLNRCDMRRKHYGDYYYGYGYGYGYGHSKKSSKDR